jgi:hypothetical protein
MGCGASTNAPVVAGGPPNGSGEVPVPMPVQDDNGAYRRRGSWVAAEHMPEITRPSSTEAQTSLKIPGILPDTVASLSSHGLKPGRNGMAHDKINQDRGLITYPFADDPKAILFGVYDGHGSNGEGVSEYVMWKIQELILSRVAQLKTDPESVLKYAFEEADRQLKVSPTQASVSGTAAVCVLCLGNKLVSRTLHAKPCMAQRPKRIEPRPIAPPKSECP